MAARIGLLVEHVLASALLEQPGELRGRVIIAPTRRAVYIEAARNLGEQYVPFAAARGREKDLAENRANGRLAVVRGDVDGPALYHVEALRWNPLDGAGILHPEEDAAAHAIRERYEFGCEILGIGGEHARSPRRTALNSVRPSSPARFWFRI